MNTQQLRTALCQPIGVDDEARRAGILAAYDDMMTPPTKHVIMVQHIGGKQEIDPDAATYAEQRRCNAEHADRMVAYFQTHGPFDLDGAHEVIKRSAYQAMSDEEAAELIAEDALIFQADQHAEYEDWIGVRGHDE